MEKMLVLISCAILLQGCVAGHQQFYNQTAPTKYPESSNVIMFEYSNLDVDNIYETFFSDFIIIGKSSFEGPYEEPSKSLDFAKSIGAHVFIAATQYSNTTSSVIPLTTPSVSTTNFNGFAGRTSYSGTATTYGTNTTYIPISVDRYNQKGLYLRNPSSKKPIWDLKKNDFTCDGESEFNGNWYNEKYELSICKSGGEIVGFIAKEPDLEMWHLDEIKLSFSSEDKFGVYFMGYKAPMPANFSINKFGHLEISLLGGAEKFSYARK